MKKILTITVLIIALLFIGGCAKSDDEIILSIDDGGSAIFKTTDMALLPISGAVPVEGEAIEKVIVLKFSNATKVGIAFEMKGVYRKDLCIRLMKEMITNGKQVKFMQKM